MILARITLDAQLRTAATCARFPCARHRRAKTFVAHSQPVRGEFRPGAEIGGVHRCVATLDRC